MATVLITGASKGIGRSLGLVFAKNGYDIIAVSDHAAPLSRAAEEFKAAGAPSAIAVTSDLTDTTAPQHLFEELRGKDLRVDILVNNAGQGQGGAFSDVPLERHIELVRLDVEAVTRLTHLFLTPMLERKDGKILNLGSIAGFYPGPLMAVYHASKAFVVSFSEALSEELKDSGVSVTCLCPGPVDTDFFETADLEDSRVYEHKDATMMSPEDVAQQGFDGLMRGERVVVPGAMNKIMVFTRRAIPLGLQAKSQKKFYERTEES